MCKQGHLFFFPWLRFFICLLKLGTSNHSVIETPKIVFKSNLVYSMMDFIWENIYVMLAIENDELAKKNSVIFKPIT
jgi:hypothetical protein